MDPQATDLKSQVKKAFSSLSRRARIVIASAVLVAAGLLSLLTLVDHTDWAVLFSGLSTEDAAQITEALRKNHTPFKLEAAGSTILAPANQVHEVRLSLAGQGLPRGGGVGFEIFDSQKFGLSDFAQQVNYRRALQGELERTITQLDAVKAVRVHLALPERRLFARKTRQSSASVTLRLQPGRSISQGSVQAIVHLVSSSESGLIPERITVVNTNGKMLWSGQGNMAGTGGGPFDVRAKMENNLEHRVQEILDTALGTGSSVVKITAEVAMSQMEQTETEFDPEKTAIRSETGLEEKESSGGPKAGGIPGVQGNLPGGPAPRVGKNAAANQRKTFTRNYEVNKTIRRRISPAGELQRLSVAVLIDDKALAIRSTIAPPAEGATKDTKGAKGGQENNEKAAALVSAKLAALEQVVKQAVGFSAERGDIVTLRNVSFAPTEPIEAPAGPWSLPNILQHKTGSLAVIAMLIFGFALLLWFMRRLLSRQAQQAELLELPATVREIESASAGSHSLGPGDSNARDLAQAAAEHDSARTAAVLSAWMTGDAK